MKSSVAASASSLAWLNLIKKSLRDSSGPWCNDIKDPDGFLLALPAMNYVRNILPRSSK